MSKGKREQNKGTLFFMPFTLFIVMCILIVAVGIIREFRIEKRVVPLEEKTVAEEPVAEKPARQEFKIEKSPTIKKAGSAQIALIIDDVGWSRDIIKEIEKINRPLTLALLPMAPASKDIFDNLKEHPQFELILHLPLEPKPPSQSFDKGLLTTEMTEETILKQFNENIEYFSPHIRGLNNHMGSMFTEDETKMRILLEEMRSKKLFFIDSMTTRKSRGYSLAKELGVKTAQRDVFIDNSSDTTAIEKQLQELVEIAREKGSAIGIGHARKNTISVLKKRIPEMESEGIKIVPASMLLE